MRRILSISVALFLASTLLLSAFGNIFPNGMPVVILGGGYYLLVSIVFFVVVLLYFFRFTNFIIVVALAFIYTVSSVKLEYHYSSNQFAYRVFNWPVYRIYTNFYMDGACYEQEFLSLTFRNDGPDRLVLLDGPWPFRSDNSVLSKFWPQCVSLEHENSQR